MILRRIVGSIFLYALASSGCAESNPSISAYIGEWTVNDVLGYSEISVGVPEAKRLLGKVLSISKNRIVFDDEVCAPKNGFVVNLIDTAPRFDKDYGKFYIPELGLPKKSFVLDSSECISIYKSSDYSVTFGWNGVILRAYK